jgi:DeoR family suf operon transcriptional repressor
LTASRLPIYDEIVENTRTKIIEILRRHHEATVEQLTKELDLAPATVRRHLDILQRDGYIDVRPVRRETGRPHYAFSLTEAGSELLPQHYVRITNRLIDEIVGLAPEDTTGRSGRELASVIFERMTDRLAGTYAHRITGTTLAERVQQVSQLLADEGMALEVQKRPNGYLVLGHGCPYRRVAENGYEACSHDQRLLSTLLRAEVEPAPLDETDPSACAYMVKDKATKRL